jgi:hypothetical protein
MIRIQIQNHDIAISGSPEQIQTILIWLQEDLEVLSERRGKQRVERTVFRI